MPGYAPAQANCASPACPLPCHSLSCHSPFLSGCHMSLVTLLPHCFAFALPSGLIHQPRPVLPPPRLLSSTSETPASAHPQVTALWAACTTNHASSLALSWHLPNFSLSHLCFNLKSYICTWFCMTHTQILWKSIKRRVKAASARSQLPAQTLSPEPRAALFLPLILSLPFVTLNNMLPPLSYRLHTVSGLLL
jgi:hypothetical protein